MGNVRKNEFRLAVTVTELGEERVAEANMEALMEAFEVRFPAAGAVAAADYHMGTLDMTFAVLAVDMKGATAEGIDIFIEAAEAAQVRATTILNVDATAVGASELYEAGDVAYV